MSAFLVAHLDAIDERLLEYLDNENDLSLDTVRRLRLHGSELLTGLITPDNDSGLKIKKNRDPRNPGHSRVS